MSAAKPLSAVSTNLFADASASFKAKKSTATLLDPSAVAEAAASAAHNLQGSAGGGTTIPGSGGRSGTTGLGAKEPFAGTPVAPSPTWSMDAGNKRTAKAAVNKIVFDQMDSDGYSQLVPLGGETFRHVQYDYRHLTAKEIAEAKQEDPSFTYDHSQPINQPQEAHFSGLKDGHMLDLVLLGSVSAHNMDPVPEGTAWDGKAWTKFMKDYQNRADNTTFAVEISYSDGRPTQRVSGLKPQRPAYAKTVPYDKEFKDEMADYGITQATVKNTVMAVNASIELKKGATVTVKIWPEQSMGADIYAAQRVWKIMST